MYLVNHFGASWSAYWWSRLGALILRLAHFTIRHQHLGAIYVDDFLWMFPKKSWVHLTAVLISLLQVLGVPLSWNKLQIGDSVIYLGWNLQLHASFSASMRTDRQQKILCWISWFLLHPRRASRIELQQFLGLLVWATQVCLHMRPFLAPLFGALYRPTQKLLRLTPGQIEELRDIIDAATMLASSKATRSDVQQGWQLLSLGGREVHKDGDKSALMQPRMKNGAAWARFKAWESYINLDEKCILSLKILKGCIASNLFHWAGFQEMLNGAADAWACASRAGIGGWFQTMQERKQWFHVPLHMNDLPKKWRWPEQLDKAIAAFELLAQQALILARAQSEPGLFTVHLQVLQDCDNMGVVGSVGKGLTLKEPMASALMSLSLTCSRLRCVANISHLAGERNEAADFLSRLNEGKKGCSTKWESIFTPNNEIKLDVAELFTDWNEFVTPRRPWVLPVTGC